MRKIPQCLVADSQYPQKINKGHPVVKLGASLNHVLASTSRFVLIRPKQDNS